MCYSVWLFQTPLHQKPMALKLRKCNKIFAYSINILQAESRKSIVIFFLLRRSVYMFTA